MTTFYTLEVIQFVVGLVIVIGNFFLIDHYRRPFLDYTFKNEEKTEKTEKAEKAEIGFMGLTNIIYFLIFFPMLFFGINLSPPANYVVTNHIQHIIYFEAALLIVIGALHFFLMAISSRIKL